MTQLEKEAEELFPISSKGGSMEMPNKHQLNNSLKQEGFIAGANSKYVQREKIKAQINILKELKDEYELNASIAPACYEKISELQQQFNESKN